MGTSAFWLVVLATTFRTTALSTVMVHFIPIMVWKGLSQQWAVSLLSTMGLFSFFSLLSLGWVADRVNKPRMMAWCTAIGSIGLLLLAYSLGEWALWLFLPLFTLLESVFPVTSATIGDIYGRKNFAKIRGTMSFFYMWGGVVGPIIAGAVYDRTQNYTPMLWVLVGLLIISSALYAMLSKPWARSLGLR
jgi:MFS family permease